MSACSKPPSFVADIRDTRVCLLFVCPEVVSSMLCLPRLSRPHLFCADPLCGPLVLVGGPQAGQGGRHGAVVLPGGQAPGPRGQGGLQGEACCQGREEKQEGGHGGREVQGGLGREDWGGGAGASEAPGRPGGSKPAPTLGILVSLLGF